MGKQFVSRAWVAIVVVVSSTFATPGLGQTGFSEENLTPIVTQMSDSLAQKLSSSSCQDLATLIQQIGNSSQTPPDPSSLLGQVMISVQNSSNLQQILISKIGSPLVSRLLSCNMISVDLLNQLSTSGSR